VDANIGAARKATSRFAPVSHEAAHNLDLSERSRIDRHEHPQ
jgi:hypothetical protein